jgi:putative transposase
MTQWPHSPAHRLSEAGAYMVTAGTHHKQRLFDSPEKLTFLHDTLLQLAGQHGWPLQAWAVLSNHYHFIALAPADPNSLRAFLQALHSLTAREVNRVDRTPGRKVWFQYWDSQITHEHSYLARLNYVHRNAAHHGLVTDPIAYQWCSAAWFERTAERAFYKTVWAFPCDQLNVLDDY